ncbi:MAG: hybrid sensor histidine kinase/response regulator, partial [Pseudomonadota bacterium]
LLQPLSAAKLYVAALAGDAERDADREMALKAQGALDSAEGIIGALLDISKLDSGAAVVDPRWFALDDILRPLRDEFAPIAAAKGLEFRLVFSRATIRSDPALLRRVLQNLISNAIRYTQAGRVLVGARRAGGSLRIEVRDTGIGVAAEDQDAIFEEFRRLGGRASASEGLGLGLAIVDRACARLGHPLALSSTPGEGSTFSVTVKRKDVDRVLGPRQAKPKTPAQSTFRIEGLDVLLVENDLELRKAVAHLIENWGANVFDAAGPEDAEALVDEGEVRPEAMLIDYQLDDGANGVDQADYVVWRDAFGGPVAAASTAVPEPSSILSVLTAVAVGCRVRTGRRRV